MTPAAVLVHHGLDRSGGGSVDTRHLVEGLGEHGFETVAVPDVAGMRRELRQRPGALVHLFGCLPYPAVFGSMAMAKHGRRPLVWTPTFHPSRVHSWKGYGLLRAMALFDRVAPRAARFADAVIAATEVEAAHFERMGAGRVCVIPPAVEEPPPLGADDVAKLRERLRLGAGPVVLVVARDNSRKGLPFARTAFAVLRDLRPDAQMVLAGVDPHHPASLDDGITCTGWLGPSDLAAAHELADVLFVPSLYEGLPRVVVEAWQSGLPVVVSDRVALAPAVAAGRGTVVRYGDPADAGSGLAAMLGDAPYAERCARRGHRLVTERFTLRGALESTAELYRQVLEATS